MATPPTHPPNYFPTQEDFQQSNVANARTQVDQEDLHAFKQQYQTEPRYESMTQPKVYDRSESGVSVETNEDDGPPKPEEFGDYEADGQFVEGQGPQLVKLFPKFRLKTLMKKHLPNLTLPPPTDTPLQFYTKRVGFNNIVVMNGFSKDGPVAYHIDVKKMSFGWNVFIHRGPDTNAPVIMQLTKKKALWDKNTQMIIKGLDTVLKHPHLLTSNINEFEYGGRVYEWYHRRLLGDLYICYDKATQEVMAICKLRFDIKAVKQIVTAWGLRINGEIEIYDKAKHMSEIILGTFMAELEWRKHQNKWFQVLLWIVTSP